MRYINVHSRSKECSKTHLQLTRTPRWPSLRELERFLSTRAREVSRYTDVFHQHYTCPPSRSNTNTWTLGGGVGGTCTTCPPVYSLAENWSTASVIFAKKSLMRYACMIFPRQTCYYSPQSNVNPKKLTLMSLSLYRSHNRDACRFF